MELKGFKEFDKILVEIKEKAPQDTGKFLMLQAEELIGDVKELTPVGKSGPFTNCISSFTVALGWSIAWMVASITSPKLCVGISVA